MSIFINFDTDNLAFENQAGNESARILRKLADQLDGIDSLEDDTKKIYDLNGAFIGCLKTVSHDGETI